MTPASLFLLEQNLNKAFGLLKPKPAALHAFKINLIQFLNKINNQENQEDFKLNLDDILTGIYSEQDRQPGNSSPVCFANVSGLREGFGEPTVTEFSSPPELDKNTLPAISLPNRFTLNASLKEAIQLTKAGIMEILKDHEIELPVDIKVLEKQIDKLVYQLFGLTPEEIAIAELEKDENSKSSRLPGI